MRLIDSHAHLDMARGGEAEVRAALERAWSGGLVAIVAVAGATRPGEFEETFALAERDPRIRVCVGVHPHAASRATSDNLERLRFALDRGPVVGLGEIGLDYHYNHSPPADQRRAFARQLRLSRDAGKPVVIHTREADDDTLAILRDEGAAELGGVIHCFSGGWPLATGALELGFFLSFSGIVTFPNAAEVREVAAGAPADRLLAETDAPFLSPVPHRGKVNEPARVRFVVEELARLRGEEPDVVAEFTVENAYRCFRFAPA
jgi:TatD DNase family protein